MSAAPLRVILFNQMQIGQVRYLGHGPILTVLRGNSGAPRRALSVFHDQVVTPRSAKPPTRLLFRHDRYDFVPELGSQRP
jgi:hypothetical protein